MAQQPNNVHYVKFFRGSTKAWETLLSIPHGVDNDTLYFIYDSLDSTVGKLYLGKKLISKNVGDENTSTITLAELADISIDGETLDHKQILVYNKFTQTWNNYSLEEIIKSEIQDFTGATDTSAGLRGLVPTPEAGDQFKFLRGDKTWASVEIPEFDEKVFNVDFNHIAEENSKRISLQGFSSAEDNTILMKKDNHIEWTKIQIPNFDEKAFEKTDNDLMSLYGFQRANAGTIPVKTADGIEWTPLKIGIISTEVPSLEELQQSFIEGALQENVLYLVPIRDDNDNVYYDEYMIVSGNLERLGAAGNIDLRDYVTNFTFNTTINRLNSTVYGTENSAGLVTRIDTINAGLGNLNDLILSPDNSTLVEEINGINLDVKDLSSRLAWKKLDDNT